VILKIESMAEFLGITVDELEEARMAGKRIPDLLEENGKSVDEFEQFVYARAKAHLQERVDAGEITQEQAEEKLKGVGEKFNQRMEKLSEKAE